VTRLLCATIATASLALATSAAAADLPSRKAPPLVAPPIFSWTGLYVGMNAGYGGGLLHGALSWVEPLFSATTANNVMTRIGGVAIGGQAGFNYQFANGVVAGLETDLQWSDQRLVGLVEGPALTPIVAVRRYAASTAGLQWFGTARLRAGYALGRFLPYVTAGLAYGRISGGNTGQFLSNLGVLWASQNFTSADRLGWTVGAGAEYALTDNLSLKTEYLYTEFGGFTGPFAEYLGPVARAGVGSNWSHRLGAHLVRAGVNYRLCGCDGGQSALLPSAFAGDLSRKVDWGGFYLGVNGGYGGGDIFIYPSSIGPFTSEAYASTIRARTAGFLAGGQIGYNLQFANNVVAGVETDLQWSNVRQSDTLNRRVVSPTLTTLDPYNDTHGGASWSGTTRLRLGYAFDRTLAYVTGGVAYARIAASSSSTVVQSNGNIDFLHSAGATTALGWALGAGLEFAVTDHVSFKTEYGYMQFGGVRGPVNEIYKTAGGTVAVPVVGSFSTGAIGTHVVRAGVNWRFGSVSSDPVIAKF
jgi:outer membrane immunogenic protein